MPGKKIRIMKKLIACTLCIVLTLALAACGGNPSTIRSDLRRGREKLKTVLKEAYDFEV